MHRCMISCLYKNYSSAVLTWSLLQRNKHRILLWSGTVILGLKRGFFLTSVYQPDCYLEMTSIVWCFCSVMLQRGKNRSLWCVLSWVRVNVYLNKCVSLLASLQLMYCKVLFGGEWTIQKLGSLVVKTPLNHQPDVNFTFSFIRQLPSSTFDQHIAGFSWIWKLFKHLGSSKYTN